MGSLVNGAAEARHGVEGAGAVEDVDVEECDEREAELAAVFADVPLLDGEDALDGAEGDDLFEEGEHVVAEVGVGEVGYWGASRPADD